MLVNLYMSLTVIALLNQCKDLLNYFKTLSTGPPYDRLPDFEQY